MNRQESLGNNGTGATNAPVAPTTTVLFDRAPPARTNTTPIDYRCSGRSNSPPLQTIQAPADCTDESSSTVSSVTFRSNDRILYPSTHSILTTLETSTDERSNEDDDGKDANETKAETLRGEPPVEMMTWREPDKQGGADAAVNQTTKNAVAATSAKVAAASANNTNKNGSSSKTRAQRLAGKQLEHICTLNSIQKKEEGGGGSKASSSKHKEDASSLAADDPSARACRARPDPSLVTVPESTSPDTTAMAASFVPTILRSTILPANLEPMRLPAAAAPDNTTDILLQRPGAYYDMPGVPEPELQRAPTLPFSLVGSSSATFSESLTQVLSGTDEEQQQQEDGDDTNNIGRDDDVSGNQGCGGGSGRGSGGSSGEEQANNNISSRLAVATEVESTTSSTKSPSMLPAAMGIDVAAVQRRKEESERSFRTGGGLLLLVAIVMIVALAVTKSITSNEVAVTASSASTSQIMPKMPNLENLELLFGDLPETTKESLCLSNTSQYMAWEWMLNHPNISAFPEWRKKQIFAVATFFYSFEGPNWKEHIQRNWLNVSTSECSWVVSDAKAAYLAKLSSNLNVFGPDAYKNEDFKPCNENGELQTLFLDQLYLPTNIKPSIPPEIGLLTSLRIFAIMYSRIGVKLSDLVVPELTQLPALQQLNFQSSGVLGTIPKEVGMMTSLRHLVIGANKLSGSIPPEISNITSLEHFILSDMEGSHGRIPSEIGMQLTSLDIERNSFSGPLPSQMGLLSNMMKLRFVENLLSGGIPSQLGLMTNVKFLSLRNNALTGSIPSELGLMTNTMLFRLGNDFRTQGYQNDLSGSLPKEVWQNSRLVSLVLSNLPILRGSIPTEIKMPFLTKLILNGSPHISGTIPESVCSIKEVEFDCSDLLCGCDCQCSSSVNRTNN